MRRHLIAALLMVAPATQARAADSAVGWMAHVQRFYDQANVVAADFAQSYFNTLYRKTQRSTGQVIFSKPGKMRWDYAAPNGKKIVADGTRMLIFEPGVDKQPGQVLEVALKQADLPQALSFLTGTGKLDAVFNANILDSAKYGFAQGVVLELMPKKPQAQYTKVIFYVDASKELKGVVHRVVIIDHDGNRNRFDFKNMRFNRPVDASTFRWQPPPGTRRVQVK